MSNFTSGILLSDGMVGGPSLSFLSDNTTGLFFNNTLNTTLGITINGDTIASFMPEVIQFTKNIQLVLNAFDKAVLTSDANGIASWQVLPECACPSNTNTNLKARAFTTSAAADFTFTIDTFIATATTTSTCGDNDGNDDDTNCAAQSSTETTFASSTTSSTPNLLGFSSPQPLIQSGAFAWNSFYTNLNFSQNIYHAIVTFKQAFTTMPNVVISKETSMPLSDGFELYITNKTSTDFTVYSNFNMFMTLLNDTVSEYSFTHLLFGGIGVVYISKTTNKVMYFSTDTLYNKITTPITLDNFTAAGSVSIITAGAVPAIAYTVYNSVNSTYEWRYTIANDVNGITFHNPIIVYNTTVNITALATPLGLTLLNVLNVPTIFTNIETGAIMVFACNSVFGLSFASGTQISNLSNHELLNVQVINNVPVLLAACATSNTLVYVQSSSANATAWPATVTQFTKADGSVLLVNPNKYSSTLGLINNVVTIIASEFGTNTLYIILTNTNTVNVLILNNAASPFVRLFVNSNTTYLLYNAGVGTTAVKTLLQFANDGTIAVETDGFINTVNAQGDNQVVQNTNDGNSIIIINTDTSLILLRFFSNDFIVNWIAVA